MDPIKKVRPGERLQIPARAWNSVLDTLRPDLGFKSGPAMASPSVLRSKSFLLNGNPSRRTRFGMIVNNVYSNLPDNYGAFAQKPPLDPGGFYGTLYPVVPFVERRKTAASRFSVLAGGSMLPNEASSGFVELITHGTCLAMVRKNPGAFLPRVRPAVIRYSTDTAVNLRGIAEDSDCGWGELLYWTNIKPFTEQRQTDEGIEEPESLDDTLTNVYYAVIRI